MGSSLAFKNNCKIGSSPLTSRAYHTPVDKICPYRNSTYCITLLYFLEQNVLFVIVRRMVNEETGRKSRECSQGVPLYRNSSARSAPPLFRKLPHQASRRLTRSALAGTL